MKNPVKTIETDVWLLGKMGIVTAAPLLLIMKQPDLGTSLVLCAIFVGMVFISGVSWKILVPIFSVNYCTYFHYFLFHIMATGFVENIFRSQTISIWTYLFLD